VSIKNIFDKFFYLEDGTDEQGSAAVQQSAPSPVPSPRQEQPQQQQQPIVNNRVKKERKMQPQQQQRNEVAQMPNNVVSLQAASSLKNSKVVLIEPRVYAEAQDIAEHLKNKRATVVNLQRIDREQGVRIIDFLSGTVYALGGDIQRIGTDIFLCTPDNVEVSGEISNYLFE
jgi:cell division inhibitor SepF